ncbi:MAG: YceI family protein [Bdellovibrionota bacterium]
MKLFIALALAFAGQANAEVLKVDTTASNVEWKGTKKIGSFHAGNVAVKEGQVETNEKGDITGGNFVLDMTKITNTDLAADPDSQKKLVGHLSSPDFFNVASHPTSTFKITSVTKKGKEHLVKGDLTILGKTNPIEFPAKITTTATSATADAKVKIDRTKWDLKYGSGNFFKELTADKIINNDIELTLKLAAKK